MIFAVALVRMHVFHKDFNTFASASSECMLFLWISVRFGSPMGGDGSSPNPCRRPAPRYRCYVFQYLAVGTRCGCGLARPICFYIDFGPFGVIKTLFFLCFRLFSHVCAETQNRLLKMIRFKQNLL